MKFEELILLYYDIVLITIAGIILIAILKKTILKKRKVSVEERVLKNYGKITGKRSFLSSIIIPVILYIIIGFLIFKKYVFFAIVLSNSMYPTIKQYDLVLIQTIDKEPRVGDIILFKGKPQDPEGRELILHRVVKITENGIYTKGDANPYIDPWIVYRDEIVGKAVTIFNIPIKIPYIGEFLVEGMERPTGRTYFSRIVNYIKVNGMIIFILIAIIYIIMSYYEDLRRKKIEEKLKELIYKRGEIR